jgi:hypothetical protein
LPALACRSIFARVNTPFRRLVAALLGLSAAGCVVAPDADERARRKEAAGYFEIEETGSRIKRKVPMTDVNAATMAGSSAVDKTGGAGMRDRNNTLPTALTGR